MVGRKERRGLATNLLVRGYAPEDDQQCQLLEWRANQFGPQGGVGKLLRAAVDIHPCNPPKGRGCMGCAKHVDRLIDGRGSLRKYAP